MSLVDQAYNHIRRSLIQGKISPGDRLSDFRISKELGISRTPVRHAIMRVRQEGFAERDPNGGYRVKRPSVEQVMEIYELRTVIEPQAAALAAGRISDKELNKLARLNAEMRDIAKGVMLMKLKVLDGEVSRRINEVDMQFHMTILRAAGNPSLLRMARQEHLLTRIFGHWHHVPRLGGKNQITRYIYLWHGRIYRALRRRDPEAARLAMLAHVNDASHHMRSNLDWLYDMQEPKADQQTKWTDDYRDRLLNIEDSDVS